MKEIEIGLRNHPEEGISFFGIDEINQMLSDGAEIIKIIPFGALGEENKDEDGNITIHITGFSLKVEIEE
jgi:hypothetical protein